MKAPIYFDYMATTPIDPRVIELMLQYMGPTGDFGNPSSIIHSHGCRAAQAVALAREKIAQVVGASTSEIIFTSGATEANNLAILGAARFRKNKGRHVITMSTEHKAVLDSFKVLEREGFLVTLIEPETNGLLSFDALQQALREDTILVSVMHVNNEIGVVQDIEAIGALLASRGILFHVDAAQSAGKLPISLRQLPVDLMSFSGHKIYGPKGIGALYVRSQAKPYLEPLSFGGGHEQGLRSGTLATHQIVGMGEAFFLAEMSREAEEALTLKRRQHLWFSIACVPGIRLNGDAFRRVAGNLNFMLPPGKTALTVLSPLSLSATAACSAATHTPSHVLRAIGLTQEEAERSVRLSLGRFTTDLEVDDAISLIQAHYMPKVFQ